LSSFNLFKTTYWNLFGRHLPTVVFLFVIFHGRHRHRHHELRERIDYAWQGKLRLHLRSNRISERDELRKALPEGDARRIGRKKTSRFLLQSFWKTHRHVPKRRDQMSIAEQSGSIVHGVGEDSRDQPRTRTIGLRVEDFLQHSSRRRSLRRWGSQSQSFPIKKKKRRRQNEGSANYPPAAAVAAEKRTMPIRDAKKKIKKIKEKRNEVDKMDDEIDSFSE